MAGCGRVASGAFGASETAAATSFRPVRASAFIFGTWVRWRKAARVHGGGTLGPRAGAEGPAGLDLFLLINFPGQVVAPGHAGYLLAASV